MQLGAYWLAPLIAGGIGAVVLAVKAKRLDREVRDLERSLRPLRATRIRRPE